jgi:hypothetical protein
MMLIRLFGLHRVLFRFLMDADFGVVFFPFPSVSSTFTFSKAVAYRANRVVLSTLLDTHFQSNSVLSFLLSLLRPLLSLIERSDVA